VQPTDETTFAAFSQAAAAFGHTSWAPRVLPPQPIATLIDAPSAPAAMLLVHPGPLTAEALLAARMLAAQAPVRGALFSDLAGGAAYEHVEDLPEPLDPRYREEAWQPGPLPSRLDELPALADEATKEGRPTTPLAHLLAIAAIGIEECHYPVLGPQTTDPRKI